VQVAKLFKISDQPIYSAEIRAHFENPAAGACVIFEGWVRNHDDGREVWSLEYEAYSELAEAEGERVLAEAQAQFDILEVKCIHRVGELEIGDCAVWIGVLGAHRKAAFEACQYVIDTLKERVPIWKKEHFKDGSTEWLPGAG